MKKAINLSQSTAISLFSVQVEIFTPFSGHVDPSRLNMTSKQLMQPIIGPNNCTPFVIDKKYRELTELQTPWTEFAEYDGYTLLADNNIIIIYYPEIQKLVHKYTPNQKKLINNSLSLKYIAKPGRIKKGDLIFDYSGMLPETHLPKIGYRTRIMFSSFYGFTADDAIVISESYAKKANIEYSQKLFIPITKSWKLLKNTRGNYLPKVGEITDTESIIRYYNIDSSDHFLAERNNLDESDSLFYTKSIECYVDAKVNNIKVHRNTQRTFIESDEDYLYTPGIIREIEELHLNNTVVEDKIKNTLIELQLPAEQVDELSSGIFETFFGTEVFPRAFEIKLKDEFDLDSDEVDYLIEVDLSLIKKTTRGDKFANLYAGKGVISLIIPDELMPSCPETGKPIELIFNPLGIFGRNNWGSIFELGLSKIIEDIESLCRDNNSEISKELQRRLDFINTNFIKLYDEEYSQEIDKIIFNLKEEDFTQQLVADINHNGFYLFVPNFPNIPYNVFYETFLKPYGEFFDINFGKSTFKISEDMIKWLRQQGYSNSVFGDEIYEMDIDAFTGSNYMLKLYHTSYSKFNSVSFAKSYSKITGMPKKGRKFGGGQHLSWQSLAGLIGHKEQNGMLKELYTIKSDTSSDIKESFLLKYISTGKYNLSNKYTSLTKQTVDNGLRLIGMRFKEEFE